MPSIRWSTSCGKVNFAGDTPATTSIPVHLCLFVVDSGKVRRREMGVLQKPKRAPRCCLTHRSKTFAADTAASTTISSVHFQPFIRVNPCLSVAKASQVEIKVDIGNACPHKPLLSFNLK